MIELIFSGLLAAVSGVAEPKALHVTACDAGEQYLYAEVECKVELYNAGGKSIHVSDIKPLRDSDRALVSAVVVESKSAAYIPVRFKLEIGTGLVNHYFVLTTDEPGNPQYQFVAKAFVSSVLDEANPLLNFGVLDADATAPSKSITLTSSEVSDLRIKRIASTPEYLDVSVQEDGHSVSVHPKAGASWGLHEDEIRLEINAPQQTQVRIRTKMDVHGAVVPAENPVNLGLMRQGQQNETLIRLTSKTGKDFKIGTLHTRALDAKVSVQHCIPEASGCSLLKLSFNRTQPVGEVKGIVLVDLPEYSQTLPIVVWGMLVRPQTEVKTIGSESGKDQSSISSIDYSSVSSAPRPALIEDAIKRAVASSEDTAEPSGKGPLLKWSVANELGIHGYIIYRADAESGPFLRVNVQTIRASNVDYGSSSYQWRDNTAVSGKTYWYFVGLIRNNGTKQPLSGPQKVVAK